MAFETFLRALIIAFGLFFCAAALLHYQPKRPWLALLPVLSIAGISYLSYFPRAQLSVVSYFRLCSLLVVVSLYQVVLVLLVWWAVHEVVGVRHLFWLYWRYALLTPYVFVVIAFGRLSPGLTRTDPRRYLVNLMYDPPSIALCYLYSQVVHWPLNSLFTCVTPQLLLGSLPFAARR